MQTRLRSLLVTAVFTLAASPAAALDCTPIMKLNAEGKSPRDIALALSLTTPQVEECLANPAEPEIRRESEEIDGAIEREAEFEGAIDEDDPLWNQE